MNALERATGAVREAGGVELWERLEALERPASPPPPPEVDAPPAPDRGAAPELDVLIAGGGLSLLLAPALARRGLRVAVLDRATVGRAHREWNASAPELTPLIREGIVDAAGLEELIVARYDQGVCRWYRGGSYPVRGVLDVAVDAERLLTEARARATELGVQILDHTELVGLRSGPGGIAASLRSRTGAIRALGAKLLVDARGASRAGAEADLICPTVGGVLEGLEVGEAPDALDPRVGEILATTEDVEEGRQHIWETFPGRPNEATVYLFYYASRGALPERPLTRLFARFFETRPRYKRGAARLLRPTFGLIPGWSRLRAAPRPTAPRVVLFGDRAARHSPLTYCGFGHMLRSLSASASAIVELIDGAPDRLARPIPALIPDAPIHRATGALSRMMARPTRDRGALNRLLDAAFSTLASMGEDPYRALLQDRLSSRRFVDFLRRTARSYPRAYAEVWRALGPLGLLWWGAQLGRDLLRSELE